MTPKFKVEKDLLRRIDGYLAKPEAQDTIVDHIRAVVEKSGKKFTEAEKAALLRILATDSGKSNAVKFIREIVKQKLADESLKQINSELGKDGRPKDDSSAIKALLQHLPITDTDMKVYFTSIKDSVAKKNPHYGP